MPLSRPVHVLVAAALGAGLVLSTAPAASAAPAKGPSITAAKAGAAAKATRAPATKKASATKKTVATKKKAAKLTAAQERRLAPLRKQVGASLAKVEAALVRAQRESARTAGLTADHRTGLTAASTAVKAELGRLRTAAASATTAAQLVALRRQVPVTAPGVLAGTTRVVARADQVTAASVAADAALAKAVDDAVAAGKDVSGLQVRIDAARAAAAQARETLKTASDALVASAGAPAARPATARAQARVSALTGQLQGRTGALRELATQVAELEAPAPTEPAPTA